MPELADVEGWKRYVARYAAGRRVRRVRVLDRAVLRNTSPQGLGRALHGRRLGRPGRHGKWLLVPVGDGQLVLHFGMTSELGWTGQPEKRTDRFVRVVFELAGGELRYVSQRKFGGVWWLSARDDLEEVTGPLGPDAAALEPAEIRDRLEGRRGGIKAALMDQSLLAGLGNELSDEILWKAGVRPDAAVADLARERREAIGRATRRVLRRAMKHGRIPRRGRWITAVRDADAAHCPRCDAALERDTVAGRTSVWCPRCQDGA